MNYLEEYGKKLEMESNNIIDENNINETKIDKNKIDD